MVWFAFFDELFRFFGRDLSSSQCFMSRSGLGVSPWLRDIDRHLAILNQPNFAVRRADEDRLLQDFTRRGEVEQPEIARSGSGDYAP
jgi:hypothetical protein